MRCIYKNQETRISYVYGFDIHDFIKTNYPLYFFKKLGIPQRICTFRAFIKPTIDAAFGDNFRCRWVCPGRYPFKQRFGEDGRDQ